MNPKIIETVNEKLEEILHEAVFDERQEAIFIRYYGVNCNRMDPKSIAKEIKMPLKKLKIELMKIEKKVFNILKKHD